MNHIIRDILMGTKDIGHMQVRTCNPGTQEAKDGGSRVGGPGWATE